MNNYLIKTLAKYASNQDKAMASNSHYFWIEGLKVRVSDHSTPFDHDLAIYKAPRGYIAIPNGVPNKRVFQCTSVKQVLALISSMAITRSLYIAPVLTTDQSEFISDLHNLGCYFKPRALECLKRLNPAVQTLLHKYLTALDSPNARYEAVGSILGMHESKRIDWLQDKIDELEGN